MRILGVSGSLRESSYNTGLLRAAAEAAPDGVELELWEGLAELPLYDEELDGEHAPAAVQRLREAWGEADAILFATPEYNGSVPGGLKNAIDWASRPVRAGALNNKTVAVVGDCRSRASRRGRRVVRCWCGRSRRTPSRRAWCG